MAPCTVAAPEWRSRARVAAAAASRTAYTPGQPFEPEPSSLRRVLVPPRSCDSASSPPLFIPCSSPPGLCLRALLAGGRPSPLFPRASSPSGVPESPQGVCLRPSCGRSVGGADLLASSSRSVDLRSTFSTPQPPRCPWLEALGCWGSRTHAAGERKERASSLRDPSWN